MLTPFPPRRTLTEGAPDAMPPRRPNSPISPSLSIVFAQQRRTIPVSNSLSEKYGDRLAQAPAMTCRSRRQGATNKKLYGRISKSPRWPKRLLSAVLWSSSCSAELHAACSTALRKPQLHDSKTFVSNCPVPWLPAPSRVRILFPIRPSSVQ